jgi:hypothetical protein
MVSCMKITMEFGRERRTDVLIDEVAQGYTTHPGWEPTCAVDCPHFADEAQQVNTP